MRILQIIDSLKVGGAQKLVAEFAREMQTREHQINIIVLSHSDLESPVYYDLQDLDVRIEWQPFNTIADLRAVFRLTEKIRNIQPDIIHTQLNYANIHGALAARITGVPVIASLHNASVHLYRYRPYRTWLETLTLRHYSKRIVACGHTVASAQQHRFPKKTLDVIPNPVPNQPKVSNAQKQAIRKQYLSDQKGILLISVGRLIPEKGYADLIAVLRILNQQSEKEIRLLIVGDGYLRAELEETTAKADLTDFVLFLGERDNVPLLLAASDIYAGASHYEGQSLAVLEAMASGLPVVVTDVGDNCRVINEECGSILPAGKPAMLAEEVMRLIQNPLERKQIGNSAKKCVSENYSVSKWVDQLMSLYDEVING